MKEIPFSTVVKRKASRAKILNADNYSDYYSHPTFLAHSVSEYIGIISLLSSSNKDISIGDTVVYRGIADEKYELVPGIARLGNLYIDTEEKLINDFLTRRPDAFVGLSDFDVLAKMQHYGLPTRLLDFSANPLIALFFACESAFRKDGRIVCCNSFVENDSSAYISAVCNAIVSKSFDHFKVEDFFCNENLTLTKYLDNAYFYQSSTVIRPKYWNQRIANQAGLFMLFPNAIIDRYRTVLICAEKLGIEDAIASYGKGKTDPEKIKKALSIEPIEYYRTMDNSFVTEESYKRLRESYHNNDQVFKDMIQDRFMIANRINKLSKAKIRKNCCSIIIKGKDKQKILKELSYLGIGIDYIYPELEYTAQEIKQHIETCPYDEYVFLGQNGTVGACPQVSHFDDE